MYNDFKVDDGFNILKLGIREAEKEQTLNFIASTYDPNDNIIRDGLYPGGRKLITFKGVLQQGVFPLPQLMQLAMKNGADAMRRPVEIEFACNINPDRTGEFCLLQIRPIVDSKQMLEEDITRIDGNRCLLRSHNSLGHGISEDVTDVVYVKMSDSYNAAENPQIVDEVDTINRKFLESRQNYILIGPGRWGSSDPWLGIPVKWPNISAANIIVEVALPHYHVDPSQGTHFFQNLTSFGVGYFTISIGHDNGEVFRKDVLDRMPAVEETAHVRHVRFPKPLKSLMDGKKQEGIVLLPEKETTQKEIN